MAKRLRVTACDNKQQTLAGKYGGIRNGKGKGQSPANINREPRGARETKKTRKQGGPTYGACMASLIIWRMMMTAIRLLTGGGQLLNFQASDAEIANGLLSRLPRLFVPVPRSLRLLLGRKAQDVFNSQRRQAASTGAAGEEQEGTESTPTLFWRPSRIDGTPNSLYFFLLSFSSVLAYPLNFLFFSLPFLPFSGKLEREGGRGWSAVVAGKQATRVFSRLFPIFM